MNPEIAETPENIEFDPFSFIVPAYAEVVLAEVVVPAGWRDVKPDRVTDLAASIAAQGLLQPIGVWYRDDGRYVLAFGLHRLRALLLLGHETATARLLDFADDRERQLATDAENLFRSPLTAGEAAAALGRWQAYYHEKHPDAAMTGGELQAAAGAAEGIAPQHPPARATPRFDVHAAAVTGQHPVTIRKNLALVKKLGEEALEVLGRRGLTGRALGQLAAVPDADARRRAVALACAGMPVAEAIVQGAIPPGTLVEADMDDDDDGPAGAPRRRVEAEMDDDEWLQAYCGEVVRKLRAQEPYRQDALLYRQVREATAAYRRQLRGPLAQARGGKRGAFHHILANLANVEHPAQWLPCGACQGRGLDGNVGSCGPCRGNGYILTYTRETGKHRKG